MENQAFHYIEPHAVHTVTVVGAGSVGRSAAAMFLAHGYRVVVVDPKVAQRDIEAFVTDTWPVLKQLDRNVTDEPRFDQLVMEESLQKAVLQADLVQENTLEDPAFKRKIVAEIDGHLPADRLILSTSGGIPPSVIQADCRFPHRVVVAHPFHPAYLIPLVEIVGGAQTSAAAVEWARSFCAQLGKRPIVLRREVTGHLGNRFQAALLQEAFHCLAEGVASARDIDDAIRYGLGPRWALLGPLLTFHLSGGSGGAAHTFEMASAAFERWWADLGRVKLTTDVRERIVAAIDDMAGTRSVAEWAEWRDSRLAGLIEYLQRAEGRSANA